MNNSFERPFKSDVINSCGSLLTKIQFRRQGVDLIFDKAEMQFVPLIEGTFCLAHSFDQHTSRRTFHVHGPCSCNSIEIARITYPHSLKTERSAAQITMTVHVKNKREVFRSISQSMNNRGIENKIYQALFAKPLSRHSLIFAPPIRLLFHVNRLPLKLKSIKPAALEN